MRALTGPEGTGERAIAQFDRITMKDKRASFGSRPAALALAVGAAYSASFGATPAVGQPVTAVIQGASVDRAPLQRLAEQAKGGTFGNIDHLLVIRGDNEILLDERMRRDYNSISRGKTSPLGCGIDACTDSAKIEPYNYLHPRFHPWWNGTGVHTLQSVTKSVTATLLGIAQHRGEIKSMRTSLLPFFDAYHLPGLIDDRLRNASLADLLTMRSGIEWHESDRPLDETNTTLQLERSPDWIKFTLGQPMDAAPGVKWAYNSGGSQLMSEVVRRSTGMHADKYAEQYLFGPLGITSYHWKHTPTGHPDTEGGLFLAPADLAKIGQLYLNDGVWKGKRLLPAGWAKEATARHVANTDPNNTNSPGYGYQWWRYDRRGVDVWAGNGFGGQFLVVVPQYRLVGVVNSWNVFGERVPGILGPFIDAMLNAAGAPAAAPRPSSPPTAAQPGGAGQELRRCRLFRGHIAAHYRESEASSLLEPTATDLRRVQGEGPGVLGALRACNRLLPRH
jgi:CubicO group peptidase (beta-lactamase class C family)